MSEELPEGAFKVERFVKGGLSGGKEIHLAEGDAALILRNGNVLEIRHEHRDGAGHIEQTHAIVGGLMVLLTGPSAELFITSVVAAMQADMNNKGFPGGKLWFRGGHHDEE